VKPDDDLRLNALVIGEFAESALRTSPGPWKVVASFEKATYLAAGSQVVAVTARRVPPGPLYVTVNADNVGARDGAAVSCTADRLEFDRHSFTLSTANIWKGPLPDPHELSARRATVIDMLTALADASALATEPFSRQTREGLARLRQGDFRGLARSLAGLGPGFTPAGDDALAGLLMTKAALASQAAGHWSIDRETAQRTGPVSRAFIECAAAGQAIAPVHQVLMAGAAGDESARLAACEKLRTVGGTSGADIAFGMRAALQNL